MYYWHMYLYMNIYVCVYTPLICPSYTVVFTFPQMRNLWRYYSFSLLLSRWIKQSHENHCVYICNYTHTHMANTYTHTILSLVLLQVGSWKNVGKVSYFCLCLEHVKCYVFGIYFVACLIFIKLILGRIQNELISLKY